MTTTLSTRPGPIPAFPEPESSPADLPIPPELESGYLSSPTRLLIFLIPDPTGFIPLYIAAAPDPRRWIQKTRTRPTPIGHYLRPHPEILSASRWIPLQTCDLREAPAWLDHYCRLHSLGPPRSLMTSLKPGGRPRRSTPARKRKRKLDPEADFQVDYRPLESSP